MKTQIVIPDLIRNLYKYFLVVPLLFVIVSHYSSFALADAKSDYDYQYGQYRQNYIEYTILKKDYLDRPSLDNQQKAILSAKQSIIARELAKASLAWYLTDLIHSSNVVYEPLRPLVASLETARIYFLGQAQKSQSIITEEDLRLYTDNYVKTVTPNDQSFKYGIIVNKITRMVRFQEDLQKAFNDLLPKLPESLPTTLNARIDELKEDKIGIDKKIEVLAQSLDPILGEENVDSEIFFTARTEKLSEIRSLQLDWIEKLIDIDINYVQTQI
jgi:hypothetical protein